MELLAQNIDQLHRLDKSVLDFLPTVQLPNESTVSAVCPKNLDFYEMCYLYSTLKIYSLVSKKILTLKDPKKW